MAWSISVHSYRVCDISATRSPASIPAATRPLATATTSPENWAAVTSCQLWNDPAEDGIGEVGGGGDLRQGRNAEFAHGISRDVATWRFKLRPYQPRVIAGQFPVTILPRGPLTVVGCEFTW